MTKILTDGEAAKIINDAVHADLIDCGDAYQHFLEDLGELIASHFGGDFAGVITPDEKHKDYSLRFGWNECVPNDGGAFLNYDENVSIEKWKGGIKEV